MAIMTQRKPETQRIIDYLDNLENGSTATYADIATHCGWDRKQKHLLYSAVQYLARNGVIYRSIPGVGYERLDPSKGIARVREWHGGQLERSTKRMASKVDSTPVGALNREGRDEYRLAQQEVTARRLYLESIEEEDRLASLRAAQLKLEQEKARQALADQQAYLERLEQRQG